MSNMEYTDENVMALAQKIVDAMDLKDLMNYVYDDLCAIMDKDEEMFNCNLENFCQDQAMSKKKPTGIVEQMREAKTKKEKNALKKKAQGYEYISPKTLRKLKRLSK